MLAPPSPTPPLFSLRSQDETTPGIPAGFRNFEERSLLLSTAFVPKIWLACHLEIQRLVTCVCFCISKVVHVPSHDCPHTVAHLQGFGILSLGQESKLWTWKHWQTWFTEFTGFISWNSKTVLTPFTDSGLKQMPQDASCKASCFSLSARFRASSASQKMRYWELGTEKKKSVEECRM